MVTNDKSDSSSANKDAKLKYRYLKSTHFRSIKVDGAWGGLTPRGDIIMSLYNERLQIPDEQEYEVSEAGSLKLSNEITQHEGMIREVEIVAMMRPEVAVALFNWLQQMIREFENQTGIKFEIGEDGSVKVRPPEAKSIV